MASLNINNKMVINNNNNDNKTQKHITNKISRLYITQTTLTYIDVKKLLIIIHE